MEKIRVGILGLGRGFVHLQTFLELDNALVVGVADRLPRFREKAAAAIAGRETEVVAEFEELLALKPDAVVIASNGKLQVEHTLMALAAGCHVLCEVPGIYSIEQALRIRDAVEQSGLTYMFGENTCFDHHLPYWRKWIVEDRFGPISLIEAEYVHYLPETLVAEDGTLLTPTQAGGRDDVKPVWRADMPPIQYLTHDLGPALELIDDRCVSVVCRSAPHWCTESPLRPDSQMALFETAKGTLIRILVSFGNKRPCNHNMRIFGTEGGVEHLTHEGCSRRFQRGQKESSGWEAIPLTNVTPGAKVSPGHGGSDRKMAQQFIKCLLEGKSSPIDVYRMIDYSLPGIIAAKSAELGGTPLSIPNLRRHPYTGTHFWDAVGLPEDEPEARPYKDLAICGRLGGGKLEGRCK
jgi:predicted dehydrogenase